METQCCVVWSEQGTQSVRWGSLLHHISNITQKIKRVRIPCASVVAGSQWAGSFQTTDVQWKNLLVFNLQTAQISLFSCSERDRDPETAKWNPATSNINIHTHLISLNGGDMCICYQHLWRELVSLDIAVLWLMLFIVQWKFHSEKKMRSTCFLS